MSLEPPDQKRPTTRSLLIGLSLTLVLAGVFWLRQNGNPIPEPVPDSPRNRKSIATGSTAQLPELEAREAHMDRTLWAPEILAQRCGRVLDELWNSTRRATNKFAAIQELDFQSIEWPVFTLPQTGPHLILLHAPSGLSERRTRSEWADWLQSRDREGWRLLQMELRHQRFVRDLDGRPQWSEYYFSAHLVHTNELDRASLEGPIKIHWGPGTHENAPVGVRSMDASRIQLATRRGPTPFQLALNEHLLPPRNSYSIDPLIVFDFDEDGVSEIVAANLNLVFSRQPGGNFRAGTLCRESPGLIGTALAGHFDGDSFPDWLVLNDRGLQLYSGSGRTHFESTPRLVWPAPSTLKHPMVMTSGDIDADGDLDVFLAQYKVPYEEGAMPTPFDNANDGHPAYLLLNDGSNGFRDVTIQAGLGMKRLRRTYSASLVDFDSDSDLDLAVISDFAGLDFYRNDGRGRFEDVSATWFGERRAFGMAHALADFNADGRLDLLMMGMTSPTASRLEGLGLWREQEGHSHGARAAMTRGNRLFLSSPGMTWNESGLSESIAQSGWSWGCAAFDFDNDGDLDVYVGNGLESRESVVDYESQYWLHDAFVGDSNENSLNYLYFKSVFTRTRGRGQSYGGYDKNRFFIRHGDRFLEAAHLLGVGLENDTRNVVAEDLDSDGRVDLILTCFEVWPDPKQSLRVYMNRTDTQGNQWVGFRPRGRAGDPGTAMEVELSAGGPRWIRHVVDGDSYRSQHSRTLHFGLGHAQRIERVRVRMVGQGPAEWGLPRLNQYSELGSDGGDRPKAPK